VNIKIGDRLEINLRLSFVDKDDWVKFWNNPIGDDSEALEAAQIIASKGFDGTKNPRFFRTIDRFGQVTQA
jgi:hypothetical protein